MTVETITKRIVFLIGSMGRGGAERVITILANNYAKKGWKVDIIMLLNSQCDYELDKNINLISICNEGKSRIKYFPKWIFNIRRYIVKNKPDRIISFIARINIITILSCIGLKQRIIISERNDPRSDGRSIVVRLATHILYPIANGIVFQTKWAQSCFSKRIQKKSVIIPNPIHVTTQALDKKEKKIVAVGRLVEQKNHSMLINAFKKILEDHQDYKLYIYGEGRLRVELKKQIHELELTKAVFLPGNVSNIHEKIADAEMFVLSSNYEGLSNALLEAMMIGIPCISTDCAGSNEVIEDNLNGLIVPVGGEQEIIKGIKLLISDENLRNNISQNARITASKFKANAITRKWEKIIAYEY